MSTIFDKIGNFYQSLGLSVPEGEEILTHERLGHESEEQYEMFLVFLASPDYFIVHEGPYLVVSQDVTITGIKTLYHNNKWLHRKICEAASRFELVEYQDEMSPSQKLDHLINYAKLTADGSLAISSVIYSKCMTAVDAIDPTDMSISEIASLLKVGVSLGEYGIEMAASINGFTQILDSLVELEDDA